MKLKGNRDCPMNVSPAGTIRSAGIRLCFREVALYVILAAAARGCLGTGVMGIDLFPTFGNIPTRRENYAWWVFVYGVSRCLFVYPVRFHRDAYVRRGIDISMIAYGILF